MVPYPHRRRAPHSIFTMTDMALLLWHVRWGRESRMGAVAWAIRQRSVCPPFYVSLQHTVAEEVEPFLPSVLQRGLAFVECQPEPRRHRLGPRQSLGRTSATEDDQVVGIRDDVCTKRFSPSGQPPVLQESVHVDVGEQWARDAALRRAARVALATPDAPGPVTFIPFLDRRFQPQLDQPGHVPVHDATSH